MIDKCFPFIQTKWLHNTNNRMKNKSMKQENKQTSKTHTHTT